MKDFSERAKQFTEYTEAPWGVMRAEMVECQLRPHLPPGTLNVLDVGCGPGEMVIRMAKLGHHVVGVDFAPGMLVQAKQRIAKAGLQAEFIEGDLRELPARVRRSSFDLVMCHGLLEYLDGLESGVETLASLVREGGLLSVLVSNPNGRFIKTVVLDKNPKDAMAGLTRPDHPNKIFSSRTRIYQLTEVTASLEVVGFHVAAVYGVRVLSDLIADNTPKYDPEFFTDLLNLEMSICQQEPFRSIAAYTHVVARKNPPLPK